MAIYMRVFILVLFLGFGLCSFGNEEGVKCTLAKAGSNRPELEKVLAHYKNDALRYQAACFLIENMDAHYCFASKNIDAYYQEMDSVFSLPVKPDSIYVNGYVHASTKNGDLHENAKVLWDHQTLSSEQLIRQIDEAFEMWQQPWNKDVSFNMFCKYVLPYRITTEPVTDWRKKYFDTYFDRFKYLLHAQINYTTKFGMYKELNKWFYGALYYPSTYLPEMPLDLLIKMRMGNCESNGKRNMSQLRAVGIPTAMDYVPMWGNRSMSHSWNVIFVDDEKFIPFGLNEELGIHFFFRPNDKLPKVYRYTFDKQPEQVEYCADSTSITIEALHNPCLMDVTDKYVETSDVTVKVDSERKGYKSPWIHLCVFTENEWYPICYAKREDGVAIFKKMGKGVVYLPVSYNKIGDMITEGNPFILYPDGSQKEIVANTSQLQKLRAVRKYTLTLEQKDYCAQMENGEFHVANKEDFSDSLIVGMAKNVKESRFYSFKPKYKGSYRFFRYMAPANSYGNVAEIELYDKDGNKLKPKRVYGYRWTVRGHEQPKLYDGDPLTSFTLQATKRGWCGVELEEPTHISEIRYIPRNDGNYIAEGDKYQLYFWDKDDWHLLAEKIGNRDGVLWFDKVPKDGLYVLRDISNGKQERIFTYENGEQIWW